MDYLYLTGDAAGYFSSSCTGFGFKAPSFSFFL